MLVLIVILFTGCSTSVRSGLDEIDTAPAASSHMEGYGYRPEDTDYDSMTMYELLEKHKFEFIIKKYAGCDTLKPHETSIVGQAYYFLDDDLKAIEFFDKAIDSGMEKAPTYYYRAGAYAMLGKYEESLKDYRKVLEIDPYDAMAFNKMSEMFLKMNLPDSAIALGNKIIELKSEERTPPVFLYTIIPKAYLHKGETEKALAKIDEIAPMIPNDENERAMFLYLKFDICAYELQDTLRAEKALLDIINDNRKSYLSYSVVMRGLNEIKKYEKADSLFRVLKDFYDTGVLAEAVGSDYNSVIYEQIFLKDGYRIYVWRELKYPEKFPESIYIAELYDPYDKMIRRIQTELGKSIFSEEPSHFLGEYLVNGHQTFQYGWNSKDIPYESFRRIAVEILKSGIE